jgi:hypothetical protein
MDEKESGKNFGIKQKGDEMREELAEVGGRMIGFIATWPGEEPFRYGFNWLKGFCEMLEGAWLRGEVMGDPAMLGRFEVAEGARFPRVSWKELAEIKGEIIHEKWTEPEKGVKVSIAPWRFELGHSFETGKDIVRCYRRLDWQSVV